MNQKEQLRLSLRVHGRKMTRQRLLVLEILNENQEHLDAVALYSLARERDPRISLATVYRSLALLKEAGLVQEHRLGQDHGHFETTQPTPHYHFTCIRCGRVIEFEAPLVTELARTLCQSQNVQVIEVHLHLSGYCSQCAQGSPDCFDTESRVSPAGECS